MKEEGGGPSDLRCKSMTFCNVNFFCETIVNEKVLLSGSGKHLFYFSGRGRVNECSYLKAQYLHMGVKVSGIVIM